MLLGDIHAVLMFIGFLILFIGFFTARYMKRKNWWMKAHRTLGLSGASLTMLGVFAIVFNLLFFEHPHFTLLHAYVGLMIAMLAAIMPTLGFMQLKIRKAAGRIRPIHRLFGWIMLAAMIVNIILGISMAQT
jgi:hypothetical protein